MGRGFRGEFWSSLFSEHKVLDIGSVLRIALSVGNKGYSVFL